MRRAAYFCPHSLVACSSGKESHQVRRKAHDEKGAEGEQIPPEDAGATRGHEYDLKGERAPDVWRNGGGGRPGKERNTTGARAQRAGPQLGTAVGRLAHLTTTRTARAGGARPRLRRQGRPGNTSRRTFDRPEGSDLSSSGSLAVEVLREGQRWCGRNATPTATAASNTGCWTNWEGDPVDRVG